MRSGNANVAGNEWIFATSRGEKYRTRGGCVFSFSFATSPRTSGSNSPSHALKSNLFSARNEPVPFVNLPYDLVKQLHFRSFGRTASTLSLAFRSSAIGTACSDQREEESTSSDPGSRNPRSEATPYVAVTEPGETPRGSPPELSSWRAFATAAACAAVCPSSRRGRGTVASVGSARSRSSSYPRGTQCFGCERHERGGERRTGGRPGWTGPSLPSASASFSSSFPSAHCSPLVFATQK
mmetsp:Transcript_1383/g.5667  ORF Transcript_1383/g.5667 Transcript_1383/m.5667 type:complete len:239 (-) Transcript_1383:803-1519(-)